MSDPSDTPIPPAPEGTPEGAEAWPSAGVGTRAPAEPRPEAAPKRAVAGVGFLLDALRRRRGGRIFLWSIVVGLALAGVGLLSYPFLTDIWAGRIQNGLESQWNQASGGGVSAYETRTFKPGEALTKIKIPKLHVSVIVVEGVTGNALRAGAGHYPSSALPGDPTGNVAIAGHRTGFGEPFRHLEALTQGDQIELSTPIGRYIYEVVAPFDGHENPWITDATDWTVISPTPDPMLTLTTCDPPGTSLNRMIVRARLLRSLPAA